jgi:hypothetical protein
MQQQHALLFQPDVAGTSAELQKGQRGAHGESHGACAP